MRRSRVLLAAVLCFAMVGGVAYGEAGKKAGKPVKKAPPTPEEVFAMLDTNKDGAVDLKELMAAKQLKGDEERAKRVLSAWDANGDGKATKEEFQKAMEAQAQAREKQFAKLDVNGDKSLTLDELKNAKQTGGDEAKAKALLESLDEDKDGKVSVKEFTKVRNVFQVPPTGKKKA